MKKILWVLSLAVNAGFTQAQSISQPVLRPDVYLITIDTLRADHVHCYGDDQIKTPALDSLARDGVRFGQAFTPSPITNTSHTSIMTGLLPSVHGVTDFGMPLAKTYPTWAELLKSDGYQTAAFIGAVILDSRTLAPGLDRGFDYYDNFPVHMDPRQHWGRVERRGSEVVRRAERWMDAHPRNPRFVWVHLYDPHDPYEPPPPYSEIYKEHLYDGEIAYDDAALGNLLVYLKRHHRYRNSEVIVVGDHGEGLGDHGEQTHGIFLYDTTTHVPLIIKPALDPGGHEGLVVDEQVQTTDILPTVLDLLGIPAPPGMKERSLALYLEGKKDKERIAFGETDYPLRFGWAPLRAVRADGFKFIEAPKPELYDLRRDQAELRNTYEPWNETVQQLRKDLVASPMRAPRSSQDTGAAGADKLSELRALGYLGPGDEKTSTDTPELSSLPDPKDKIEEQNLLHSAMLLADEGRLADARVSLEKLLRLNPDSPAALRQLGELELTAGRYREAAEYLARAQKDRPSDPALAMEQAQAQEKSGDWQGARAALESVLKQSAGRIDARLLLAHVDDELGDKQSAEDQLEAVLLLSPTNQEAVLGLAVEYLAEKRFQESLALLEPASKREPGNVEIDRLLASAYLGLGDKAQAEKALRRVKEKGAKK